MLERVGERFGDRILDPIDPDSTDQRAAETGLHERHEVLELR